MYSEPLSLVFPSLEPSTFLDKHWPNGELYFESADLCRFGNLWDDVKETDKITCEGLDNVFLWDDIGKVDVKKFAGRKFTQKELDTYTVQFRMLERNNLRLHAFLSKLADSLILPQNYCFSALYCSPANKTTHVHFDPQEIIVIQLNGSKEWRMYENLATRLPQSGYWGGAPSMELYSLNSEEQLRPGKHIDTITMQTGDALFLPRGLWHETTALEQSTSITLSFNTMTVIDAYIAILRQLEKNSIKLNQFVKHEMLMNADYLRSILSDIHLAATIESNPSAQLIKSKPIKPHWSMY